MFRDSAKKVGQWGCGREPDHYGGPLGQLSPPCMEKLPQMRVKDLGSSGTIYGGSCPFTEGLAAWEQGQERDGSLEHLNQAICSVSHNWEGRGQIANDKQLIQSPAGTMLMRLLAPYSYEQRGLGIHTHTREHTHTLLFCYVCFHYH